MVKHVFWGSFLKPLSPQLLEYICEEQVKRTKGFVLQVQQGVSHEKSHMQVAEERQSGWLNVPRIAVFAFEGGRHGIGGNSLAKTYMETALAKAEEQWTKGVEAEVQMCSERYEPVDGADKVPTDSRGSVHGMAKCTFPDGRVYIGEWQHGLMHGQGKVTNAEGTFELGFFVDGRLSGEFVQFTKDRQEACLFIDGEFSQFAQELSPSEAAKKVEELGLSKLLKWVLDPIWKDFGRRKVTKSCQMLSSLQRSELRVVYYFDRKINWNWVWTLYFSHVQSVMFLSSKIRYRKNITKWNETISGFLRNVLLKYSTLPPIIMEVKNDETWWFFKGNYYWRDPFFTSMITGDRVTTC